LSEDLHSLLREVAAALFAKEPNYVKALNEYYTVKGKAAVSSSPFDALMEELQRIRSS
jgi:hypothetical protein